MAADLYWEWLKVPADRRPPSPFDLLGLAPSADDPAEFEKAANQQVLRIKEQLDGPRAAEGAKLLQEIAQAKEMLLDPAKRAALRAGAKSGDPTWWKNAVRPATKPAAQPIPVVQPVSPPVVAAVKPAAPRQPSEFAGMGASPRVAAVRRKQARSGFGIGLLVLIGGALVGFAAIGLVCFLIFGTNKQTETTLAQNTTQETSTSQPATTSPSTSADATQPAPTTAATTQTTSVEATPVEKNPSPANEPVTPTQPMTFKRHNALVQGLALAPDRRHFLSAGDIRIIEWDLGDATKSLQRQALKTPALGIAVLRGGKLAVSGDEGGLYLLDLPGHKVLKPFPYPRGTLQAFAAAPDGMHVLTGGTDGGLLWWNLNNEKPEFGLTLSENATVTCVALSHDGKFAAAGTNDGGVGVWEIVSRRRAWFSKVHPGGATSVAFSPDDKQLASCGLDKSVAIWNASDGKSVRRFAGHDDLALCVSWMQKGSLVSGGKDAAIKIWTLDSAQPARTLKAETAVHCLAVGPEDRFLIAGGINGNLQLLIVPSVDVETVVREKPPADKLPTPEQVEVDAAAKAIQAKSPADFASAKPDELTALAQRLFERATSKSTPTQRFALFMLARDVAAKAGKLALAFQIIDEQDKWFEIDELTEKVSLLSTLSTSTPGSGQKELIDAGAKLLQRAEKEKRNDLIRQLFDAMGQAATKSGSAELVKWVDSLQSDRTKKDRNQARLEELQAKLKEMPGDREANLAYGMILCSQNNWKEGLPRISKGSDAKLGIIADKDLAGPKEPVAQKSLAAEWFEQVGTNDEWKVVLLTRAKYWYEQAKSGLAGGDKLDAVTHISKIDEQLKSLLASALKEPPPGSKPDPKNPAPRKPSSEPVSRKNFNTLRNEATIKSQWKIDGTSRVESPGLRLMANPASMTSTFQLVENWRVEILTSNDGRTIEFEVNGQLISLHPTNTPSAIVIERKGKKLLYALATGSSFSSRLDVLVIPDDKLGPSNLLVRMSGMPFLGRKEDGMLFISAVVSGLIKVEE